MNKEEVAVLIFLLVMSVVVVFKFILIKAELNTTQQIEYKTNGR